MDNTAVKDQSTASTNENQLDAFEKFHATAQSIDAKGLNHHKPPSEVARSAPTAVAKKERVYLAPVHYEYIKDLLTEHQDGQTKSKLHSDLERLRCISKAVYEANHKAASEHGKYIMQARDILRSYKGESFEAWANYFYGNKKTAYNLLNYYLYSQKIEQSEEMTKEEKTEVLDLFLQMPKKVAYRLNSSDLKLKEQLEFIKDSKNYKTADALLGRFIEVSNKDFEVIATPISDQTEKPITTEKLKVDFQKHTPKAHSEFEMSLKFLIEQFDIQASSWDEEGRTKIADLLDALLERRKLLGQNKMAMV